MPLTIPAKEARTIELTLDPIFEERMFVHSFELHFVGYRHPLEATLSGTTEFPFPSVIDLGPFQISTEMNVGVRESARRANRRISSVVCRDAALRVSAPNASTLTIAVGPLPVASRIDAMAEITFDDNLKSKQRITIRGMASGGLIVDPATVVFGRLRTSEGPVTMEIRITSQDRLPFALSKLTFDPRLFSVEMIPVTTAELLCRITVHPGEPRALDEWVTMTTVDEQRGVSVKCVGMIH